MKFKSLTKIFLFVMVSALFSCSSSEDNGNGGGTPDGPTSISVNASALFVDFGTDVNFTVTTNEGTNVTSSSTIMVDGTAITGNSYNAPTTGEYEVTATFEDLTSSSITVNVLPIIVDIDVQTAQASYNLGERIDFRVMGIDNNGNEIDITEASNVVISGSESYNTGNIVIPGVVGDVEAYATFEEFTSDTKTVSVADNGNTPGSFNKKALIEDYTGDWCGFCTRVSTAIEMVKDASDDVVVIATHLFNGDPYQNAYGLEMANALNITGLPTAYIDRDAEWNFPETSNINQVTNEANGSVQAGIAINSAIKDRDIYFIVSAGFGQNMTGTKLVVVLLENGLILDQANYYPEYYGGANPVPNFVHDHVLRYAFTSMLGDNISSTESVSNNSFRMKYDYSIPTNVVANAANVEIVAMLLDSNGRIINVNATMAGDWVDFN